ncbi:MAG: hypothetical protein GY859_16995 [Desulfobacterales bacterium]|nr:hypothetical protein [Desulfobacterales bacterium]
MRGPPSQATARQSSLWRRLAERRDSKQSQYKIYNIQDGKPRPIAPRGVRYEDENRLYELERLRHGDMVYRDMDGDAAAATMQRENRIIRRDGAALTRAFLEGEAGEALCRASGSSRTTMVKRTA